VKSEKSEEIKKTIRATFTHVHSPSTADADATASGEVNNNSAASGCVGTCASSGFLLTARTPKEMKASRALKVRVGVRVVSSDPVRGRIEPPRRAERELLQKTLLLLPLGGGGGKRKLPGSLPGSLPGWRG
tara:strand:- start:410 stop:802 length:393 start_codon:yes stop_codon:yes gene_type:complete